MVDVPNPYILAKNEEILKSLLIDSYCYIMLLILLKNVEIRTYFA